VGSALGKEDYSYRKPNRRTSNEMYHEPDGLILPSMMSDALGSIWCAIDTSGSITQSIRETFASEMMKINSLIDEVTVATCDARVHEVVKLYGFKHFLDKIKFLGGGGTDFVPVFEKIKEMGEMPELLVFLTDGYGRFPEKEPAYPVIWVLTKNGNPAPWGRNIYLPQADENTDF
jgi:predicted metal-dependent peptidase